ncbi:MAG: hypothetical protein GKS03_00445 [Alphaproteobacteria bacterium]|nr:hypothetical protein [Alphaproteobacteria bacterium]
MKRRTFLAGSSVLTIATLALPQYPVRAGEPFTDAQSAALLRMVKDIFPHDALSDEPYQAVVGQLTGAAADPNMLAMLRDGLTALDAAAEGAWIDRGEADRITALKTVESTPFFITVRVTSLFGLYGNPAIWPAFGYEGASYEQGGYLFRGFDDLDWLPEPLS